MSTSRTIYPDAAQSKNEITFTDISDQLANWQLTGCNNEDEDENPEYVFKHTSNPRTMFIKRVSTRKGNAWQAKVLTPDEEKPRIVDASTLAVSKSDIVAKVIKLTKKMNLEQFPEDQT